MYISFFTKGKTMVVARGAGWEGTTRISWRNFGVDVQNSLKSTSQWVNFTVCKLQISTNFKKGNISFLGIMLFHTHFLDNKSRIEKSWNVLYFKKQSHGIARVTPELIFTGFILKV